VGRRNACPWNFEISVWRNQETLAAFNDSSKGKGTDSPSPQRFDLESATLQTVKMVSGLCQSFFSHLPALAAK
jgi:hypothetical protein